MIEGKPSCVTDEMLIWIDHTDDDGHPNLIMAIQEKFPKLSTAEARAVYSYWAITWGQRHPEETN